MVKKILAALPLVALGACATPDELRARSVSWAAVYLARYDVMANCVAVESTGFAKSAIPFIDAKEKRAEVVVLGGYGDTLARFDLRETSDGATAAEYRNVFTHGALNADNPGARILRQCARA